MGTHVPADDTVHVHMAPETDPWSLPVFVARQYNTLPTGYANQSPRTRLRSGTSTERVPAALARRSA